MWTSYLFQDSGSPRPTCSPHSWGWTGCRALRRGGWCRWLWRCCGPRPVRSLAGAAWSAAGTPADWTWEWGRRWKPTAYRAADTQDKKNAALKKGDLKRTTFPANCYKTHISFLLEVFLNADSDSLQSCLPFLRSLAQLALQPLNVLQHHKQPAKTINATHETGTNRIELDVKVLVTGSYSEEFGDSIRLGTAHAAVARPDNPPFTVGDGVRLLRALQPHSHHPPVVTRPRGESLICEEVPLCQAGDADGRLQDHLSTRKTVMSVT